MTQILFYLSHGRDPKKWKSDVYDFFGFQNFDKDYVLRSTM